MTTRTPLHGLRSVRPEGQDELADRSKPAQTRARGDAPAFAEKLSAPDIELIISSLGEMAIERISPLVFKPAKKYFIYTSMQFVSAVSSRRSPNSGQNAR